MKVDFQRQFLSKLHHRNAEEEKKAEGNKNEEECKQVLGNMPYQQNTVFGYVTLVDPEKKIKDAIYGAPPHINIPKLDIGEGPILDSMIEGRFYSHTGSFHLNTLETVW